MHVQCITLSIAKHPCDGRGAAGATPCTCDQVWHCGIRASVPLDVSLWCITVASAAQHQHRCLHGPNASLRRTHAVQCTETVVVLSLFA